MVNPSSFLTVNTESLGTTPASAAFCTNFASCPVSVDVFGTDFSLVEGGDEDSYQESPFVTEGFWKQLLEDEDEDEDEDQ